MSSRANQSPHITTNSTGRPEHFAIGVGPSATAEDCRRRRRPHGETIRPRDGITWPRKNAKLLPGGSARGRGTRRSRTPCPCDAYPQCRALGALSGAHPSAGGALVTRRRAVPPPARSLPSASGPPDSTVRAPRPPCRAPTHPTRAWPPPNRACRLRSCAQATSRCACPDWACVTTPGSRAVRTQSRAVAPRSRACRARTRASPTPPCACSASPRSRAPLTRPPQTVSRACQLWTRARAPRHGTRRAGARTHPTRSGAPTSGTRARHDATMNRRKGPRNRMHTTPYEMSLTGVAAPP